MILRQNYVYLGDIGNIFGDAGILFVSNTSGYALNYSGAGSRGSVGEKGLCLQYDLEISSPILWMAQHIPGRAPVPFT